MRDVFDCLKMAKFYQARMYYGKSGVSYAVRFHLHPGIQASLIQEGDGVSLRAKRDWLAVYHKRCQDFSRR